LGIKRPGREADPSSAKVKNVWSYISTPQDAFIAWCLVKHRDNFTFLPLPLEQAINHIRKYIILKEIVSTKYVKLMRVISDEIYG
jgi:hypothetical protein